VKVTACEPVAVGTVLGAVKAKVPPTEAEPPVRLELDKLWPEVIAEALGAVLTVGVALLIVTLTVLVAVL
jgi:hypothetical protein